MIEELIVKFVGDNPTFAVVIMIAGSLRAINKPLFALINAIVAHTGSKTDDTWWSKAQEHQAFRCLLWFLDWTASVKLPKKENGNGNGHNPP